MIAHLSAADGLHNPCAGTSGGSWISRGGGREVSTLQLRMPTFVLAIFPKNCVELKKIYIPRVGWHQYRPSGSGNEDDVRKESGRKLNGSEKKRRKFLNLNCMCRKKSPKNIEEQQTKETQSSFMRKNEPGLNKSEEVWSGKTLLQK